MLDLDLTQAESRDQLQQQIDAAAKGIRNKIVLMQDGQNEWIQQADDLLRLCLDGYARVLAADEQLFEERPIASQVLLEFFCRDSSKEQIIITAREKLQEGKRFHETISLFQNRKQAGSGRRPRQVDGRYYLLAEVFFSLFYDIHEERFFGRIEKVKRPF